MKSGSEHRVPFSYAALAVLERVLPLRDSSDLLFPSVRGRELSNMTLTKALRTAGIDALPHGFRTSFRTWASEQTSVPHAVAEMALAHAVGSAVERSHARSDLFEKRRGLMDRWAAYVTGHSARVVRMHGRDKISGGDGCRAAGFLPIAMPSSVRNSHRSGRVRILDFHHCQQPVVKPRVAPRAVRRVAGKA